MDPSSILKQFREHVTKRASTLPDISSLSAIVDALRNPEGIDDRKFLLEHLLTFISQLPPSPFSKELEEKTVELLYNDLPHPPATLVGNGYQYREADGRNNNIDVPDLGRAGMPYSRSVQQGTANKTLPDPGLVFDTLLKRDEFREHPAGLSALMFSFAALVIHSVFRTRHADVNINDTSSYVDLAPLYGANQEEQDSVRCKEGRGYLHPDTFAESRLLLLPPAVGALLILFNRNHNYIAKKLLEINERGTWLDPEQIKGDTGKLMQQDEEIFQTARLCNCGWFGSVVFSDYFSAILGLVRSGSSWSLNPFGEIRKEGRAFFERGRGNSCSVEFNLLYRWHATTSKEDEQWLEALTRRIFGNKQPEEITRRDFSQAYAKMHVLNNDLNAWSLGHVARQSDGSFADADLAKIIQDATEDSAGSFGARGTPHIMRPHEIMGMEQARTWGVCTMNDFRRFLGLKPFESFLEWNPNPDVAKAAEMLYGDIEQLELYPGLQAEATKPMMDGAGLCPGFTVSRAILSDAIALTRGDRFFTSDFTPTNLTNWGFADCQRDPNAFGFGSTLGRLFLRTLPHDFNNKSVYTFFPLMRPAFMEPYLKDMHVMDQYDMKRPSPALQVQRVAGYRPVCDILESDNFVFPHVDHAGKVISGPGFFTTGSSKEQKQVLAAMDSSDIVALASKYFFDKTRELIDANAHPLIGRGAKAVDLVREVLTVVPVSFAAEQLAGITLKTQQSPDGVYSAKELFAMVGEIYSFIFLDVEASQVKVLENKVKEYVSELLGHIKGNMTLSQNFSLSGLLEKITSLVQINPVVKGHHIIMERLHQISPSVDGLANTVLALMVGLSMELALALTNIVNLYLGSSLDKEFHNAANGSSSAQPFEKFIWEALRLDPPFRATRKIATQQMSAFKDGVPAHLDVYSALHDDQIFSKSNDIVLGRPNINDVKTVIGLPCLCSDLATRLMNETLKAIMQYPNVRRGPGRSGELLRFADSSRPDLSYAYLDSTHMTSAWPTSMIVQFDA